MSGCAVWMGSLGETSTQASPDLQLVDCGVSWHVCTLKARELSQSGGRRWFEMGVLQWVLEGETRCSVTRKRLQRMLANTSS